MTNTTNTNGKTDWTKMELGALWRRQSSKGEKYLTGTLKFTEGVAAGQQVQVIIFSNKDKTAENQPDLRVYLSEKTNSATAQPIVKASTKPTAKAVPEVKASADDATQGDELL